MGTIILVRHGENEWTRKNKLAGRIPGVHLNETGHRQAHAIAQRLAALPIKAVYSSPITRCQETAAYIADTHRLTIRHVDEIGEVEYGEWEGKKIKRLTDKPLWRAVQFFPSRVRFPKGEAIREVQFRAVQAIEEIAAQHEKEMVVVVSHADIIRLLLAHYLGVHIDLFQRIVISPASASVIALGQEGAVHVLRVNDDGPMHPPTLPDEARKAASRRRKETSRGPAKNSITTTAPGSNSEGPAKHPAFADGRNPAQTHQQTEAVASAGALDEEE